MKTAYRKRWDAEIATTRRVLAGLGMKEECKWGKPTYTVNGKNIVILQGFKEYFALGFFQGALLKDPKTLLVQLGQVHAARVMKFTSAKDIEAKTSIIKAYVREAIAVEKAGLRMKPKKTSDFPFPEELKERFRRDPHFKRAFKALTPGRQRSFLYHFAAAKQSATRVARIDKAAPAIFDGRGLLERSPLRRLRTHATPKEKRPRSSASSIGTRPLAIRPSSVGPSTSSVASAVVPSTRSRP